MEDYLDHRKSRARRRSAPLPRQPLASLPLFDPPMTEGEQLKERGIMLVMDRRDKYADRIRAELVALFLYRQGCSTPDQHYVTADDATDVAAMCWPDGDGPDAKINAGLFRVKGWRWNGRLVKSTRPSNHAADLRCWVWEP